MAKFVVIPIAMSVRNNGIAKGGDIVDESQLNSSAYDLIRDEFIRPLTDEELEDLESEAKDPENEDEDPPKGALTDDEDAILLKSRKEKLFELGFVDSDSEDFKGVSLPSTEVVFSNEDVFGATDDEFASFVENAKELISKNDPTKGENKNVNPEISKKDAVKNALTNKK